MASLRCESELGFDLDLPGPRDTLIPLGLFVHGLTESWYRGVQVFVAQGCITEGICHRLLDTWPCLVLGLGPLQPRGCIQR